MNAITFWKWHIGADKTIARFDAGVMSNREKFTYFALTYVFISVLLYLLPWIITNFNLSFSILDTVGGYLNILLSAVGIVYLFKKHTATTSFIEKFFVVLVVTIPTLVVSAMIIGICFYVAIEVAGVSTTLPDTAWYDLILNCGISVYSFWKMGTYIK